MKDLSTFTNLYTLSKTLRFELIPQGQTLKNIQSNGLLSQDEHRAESYVVVKKIIDEYHKMFIGSSLDGFQLRGLEDYFLYYQLPKRNDVEKKKFEEIQTKLRKQIAERFSKQSGFQNLFAKELIKNDLKTFVQLEEQKILVAEFDNFTTYFTGFHENRKNMYSADEKSTAIAYRLIHENLPKFIDNIRAFDKVRISPVQTKFETILSDIELGQVIQVSTLEEIFTLDYFNETLTQTGIESYNHLIGGYTPDEGEKIKGLNEYINLYNQTAPKENRLPKLKPLYKQILSDRLTASFIPDEFFTDNEVLESIEKFTQELNELVICKKVKGEHSLKELLQNLNEFDLTRIYLRNDLSLTDISQKMYGDWGVLQKAMNLWFGNNYKGKTKPGTEKYEEEQKKYFGNQDSFSIGFLNECVQLLDFAQQQKIEQYFASAGKTEKEPANLFEQLEKNYSAVKDLLNNPYPDAMNLAQDQNNVDKIKYLLDSIKAIQWFIKPLLGKGNEAEKDERFYGEFSMLWTTLDQITPLYNKVRNYMTRKPYSTKKIQLFFENKGQFLGGWVDSKTENSDNGTQAGGYLFRKKNKIGEYDYYLGISSDAKLFRDNGENAFGEFERLDYYQLKSASVYGNSYIGGSYDLDKKSLNTSIERFVTQITDDNIRDRIFIEFSKLKDENYIPSILYNIINDKFKAYQKQLLDFEDFKIQNERVKENLRKTILSLIRVPKSQSYSDVKFETFIEAQKAIENLCIEKVFNYFPVSAEEMQNVVGRKEKPLLLFKISNKDLSFAEKNSEGKRVSRGIDNLHTMYFKALMQGNQNILDIGTGKVFFREKSLNYTYEELQKGHHYNELKSKFTYPIISNRRFAFDKFQFHLSIIQNYQQPKTAKEFELKVNKYLKDAEEIHIIGIDRGERHLLYLTMIDSLGRIVMQYSLNEILNEYNGQTYSTNYHDLLDKREGERADARLNWKSIETIKELKEGYLSQVIHKIAGMMVKYNAIVVLEDLNMGFMRGRQKVEKQVYQKFEKMLIDKLNYLVDKNRNINEPGGVLNAYQLTDSYTDFMKYKKKQCGFLFYIPAWNTSKIDPVTGFANLFGNVKNLTMREAKGFLEKFECCFDIQEQWFEFKFDYNDFNRYAVGTKSKWAVYADNKTRYRRNSKLNSGKGGQEQKTVAHRDYRLIHIVN